MTASWVRASSCATTGISIAPSTRMTVGLGTPESSATRRAPSSSALQILACQVLATIASDTSEASISGKSGTPAPPLIAALRKRCSRRSQRSAEIAGYELVVVVESGQVVTHPVALGHQVA